MSELVGRNYQGRYVAWNAACPRSQPVYAPFYAKFYRHLGRQIRRARIVNPDITVRQLVDWCYPPPAPYWAMSNIKRHCRVYGLPIR